MPFYKVTLNQRQPDGTLKAVERTARASSFDRLVAYLSDRFDFANTEALRIETLELQGFDDIPDPPPPPPEEPPP